MLTHYLHRLCRAVMDELAGAAAGAFLACDLVQIDRKEFEFQTVAATHYPSGPLRRMLIGCEERLARHLAGGGEAGGNQARVGLRQLCARVATRLSALDLGLAPQPFLLHETDRFRVFCDGPRNFHLRVAVAEGRLDLILDLAPRQLDNAWFEAELATIAGLVPDSVTESALTDPEIIERIVTHLSGSGADVQVKVQIAPNRFELLPATFLAGGYDTVHRLFLLTCARRPGILDDEVVPPRIELVFFLREKLLEIQCPVLELHAGALDEDLALPSFVAGFPEQIRYGQRRGALRFPPPEPLTGSVQRLPQGAEDLGRVRRRVPVEVEDISDTGVRLTLSAGAILSSFKPGAAVECRLQLPHRHETTRVTGVIRRVNLTGDPRLRQSASLSLEFVAELGGTESGLRELRDYLAGCDPSSRSGGIVLEPCSR
jgi:hypothetical protein